MRLLSSYELDLVAGGTGTTDDMQVNGVGGPYGDGFGGGGGGGGSSGSGYWMYFAPASHFGGYAPGGNGSWQWISTGSSGGGSAGSYGGGSGNGGDPAEPPPENECQLDAAKDVKAQAVESLIKAQADWNQREYGALILRDSTGRIYVGNLVSGETVAEAQARATAAGQTEWAPQTNFGPVPAGSTIVGIVHSHPDDGYDDTGDKLNRYPSDTDYDNMAQFVGIDSRFGSAQEFTQYILGPDGVLREYDWNEGRLAYGFDAKADSRSNLASDRPCH